PYYVKGEGLYKNFYTHVHHVEVADRVHGLRIPWIVSYDLAPAIVDLYRDHLALPYSLSYSAATRGCGREVMFFSDGLTAPDTPSPSCVDSREVDRARVAAKA